MRRAYFPKNAYMVKYQLFNLRIREKKNATNTRNSAFPPPLSHLPHKGEIISSHLLHPLVKVLLHGGHAGGQDGRRSRRPPLPGEHDLRHPRQLLGGLDPSDHRLRTRLVPVRRPKAHTTTKKNNGAGAISRKSAPPWSFQHANMSSTALRLFFAGFQRRRMQTKIQMHFNRTPHPSSDSYWVVIYPRNQPKAALVGGGERRKSNQTNESHSSVSPKKKQRTYRASPNRVPTRDPPEKKSSRLQQTCCVKTVDGRRAAEPPNKSIDSSTSEILHSSIALQKQAGSDAVNLTANSALSPISSGSTARTRFPQFLEAFLSVVAALQFSRWLLERGGGGQGRHKTARSAKVSIPLLYCGVHRCLISRGAAV